MKMKETYTVEIIRSKKRIHTFDTDNLIGPDVNADELILKLKKETQGAILLAKRNLIMYAEKGLIPKSKRSKIDRRVWTYPFRTIYDLWALSVAKNRYLFSLDRLHKSLDLSKYGLYELIFSLSNLEAKLYLGFGLPKIPRFINTIFAGIKQGDSDDKPLVISTTVGEIRAMHYEISSLPAKMGLGYSELHKDLINGFIKLTEKGANPLYIDIRVSYRDKK